MSRLQRHQLEALTAHEKLVARGAADAADFVMPAPLPKKKRDNQEFRTQSAFVAKWRANCGSLGIAQCLGFHVNNGSVMGGGNAEWQKTERAIRGRLAKLAGVEDGVADWVLLVPAGAWHGLCIEFKKPGGIVSDAQERFMGYAMSRGYWCAVCDNVDDAWELVVQYLNP